MLDGAPPGRWKEEPDSTVVRLPCLPQDRQRELEVSARHALNWADFDRGLTFSRPCLDQRLEAVPGEAAPRVLPTRGFGLAKGGQSVDQLLQQGKSAIPELQRANALDLEQQLVRQQRRLPLRTSLPEQVCLVALTAVAQFVGPTHLDFRPQLFVDHFITRFCMPL